MPDHVSLAGVIGGAIAAALEDVHTCLPCRVVSYSAATQRADVEPQVRRPMRDQNGERVVETLPVIPNVPVLFPRTASAFVSLPVAADDFVLVLFAEASVDAWQATGEVSDPGDERRHNLGHAIAAIPGVFPTAGALDDAHATNVVIGHDGATQIHVQPGGSGGVLIGGPTAAQKMVLGDALKTFLTGLILPVSGASAGPLTDPAQLGLLDLALSTRHRIDQ